MERKLRTCAVCRNSYKFCNKCNEDKNKPLWYFTFCSENCNNIYGITSKFENGQISANDAKAKLNELDLSKLDKFGASYKASIDKINATVVDDAIKVEEIILEDIVNTDINIDLETENTEIIKNAEKHLDSIYEEKPIKKSKKIKNVDIE